MFVSHIYRCIRDELSMKPGFIGNMFYNGQLYLYNMQVEWEVSYMSKSDNKSSAPAQTNKDVDESINEITEEVQDTDVIESSDDVNTEVDEESTNEESAIEESEDTGDEPAEEDDGQDDDKVVKEPIEYVGGASEDEKNANAGFRKLSFIEKCKQDPVIPISVILIFLAFIVAAIYFILPDARTPSMGMTLSEFVSGFNESGVAKALRTSGTEIGYRTPAYVDPVAKPSILGDKAVFTASSSYADFFAGTSKYYSTTGIEGAARKTDGQLSYLRIWVQYTTEDGEGDSTTVWMYFANTLNVLYPELTMYEAMDLALEKMGEFDGDTRFYCRGNYAFRLVTVTKDDAGYIVVDVLPKSAIKESQIRETVETVTTYAEVSESVEETSAAAT